MRKDRAKEQRDIRRRKGSEAQQLRAESVTVTAPSLSTALASPGYDQPGNSADKNQVEMTATTTDIYGTTQTTDSTMEQKQDQQEGQDQQKPQKPMTKLQKCLAKFNKSDKLSPDFIIVLSIYSAICGILTVYTSALPVVNAGPLPAFFDVVIVGLLFTYSIVLIVMGLRPNDPTMLDAIISESIPKAKIPLRVIGQFTSGFMMIVFQFLGFEAQAQTMLMAFFKNQSPEQTIKDYKICCIIFLFIMAIFIHIFNPAIFVPLTSLPTISTVFGFIVTIYWVCITTTAKDLQDYARGWSRKWGLWAASSKAGGGAFLTLVGVLAAAFYLHSMIQQILVNAKNPKHNVRNTVFAFIISIITILFTNFVAVLPFGSCKGEDPNNPRLVCSNPPDTNLILNMGHSPLVRANNIILFLFSIPVIPFQWAVLRQNTVGQIKWEGSKCPKLKWPTIILVQLLVLLVSFGIAWVQPNLQILLQVATFPAAIYWVCFLPSFFHIWSMCVNQEQRKKWYFIPWCLWDAFVSALLIFCEIVQFIPQL